MALYTGRNATARSFILQLLTADNEDSLCNRAVYL